MRDVSIMLGTVLFVFAYGYPDSKTSASFVVTFENEFDNPRVVVDVRMEKDCVQEREKLRNFQDSMAKRSNTQK